MVSQLRLVVSKHCSNVTKYLRVEKGIAASGFPLAAICLPGNDLLSHDSTIGVLGLTAVFGMETGVAPAL